MPRGGKRPGAGRPRKNGGATDAKAASFESTLPTYDRPQIWMASLEAKREATAHDRLTCMKNARWAVNNSGIASRVVRGVARFAVGNGLVPQCQSADHDFNRAAEQLFEDRYANVPWAFDKAGVFDFYSVQQALIESMICDGDVFAQLTRSEAGNPMCRFFTGEYVGDAITNSRETNIHDGIIFNADNRPVKYRVLTNPTESRSNFADVPAEDIVHMRRVHRMGYMRGISWIASAVARIQDIREALDNELAAAKLNSKVALILESEKGTTGLGAGIQRVQTGSGSTVALDKLVPGVGTVQLAKGETLNAHSFDRPNSNLPTFVDYLSREIAYAVGVSPEVIWSLAGLGGTASRAALMDADVFFGGVRLLIEQQFCVRFWRYAIWDFIRKGILPYPGDDWFRVSFVPPQKTSVDIGRDGKLRLELVRAGLLSRRQYFNELGRDSDTETEDIIRDVARRKKAIERIAAEEGVTLTEAEVFPPAPGAASPYEEEADGVDEEEEDDDEVLETRREQQEENE
jgi:lambda family phage portal protein